MPTGVILTVPPDGKIACRSDDCVQDKVEYSFASVRDAELKEELENGKTGQAVTFELSLGGTAAINIVKR